jgi:DNA-directed RNA polymerase specialized sigma24 family protein
MDRARQEFDTNVHRIRQMWHEFNNALKDFERRAEKNPKACAEEALRKIAYESNLYRVSHKRLFGLDLKRKAEWWGQVPLPSDPDSRALFVGCVVLYELFQGTWKVYREAIKRPDLNGDNLARAMCEIYVEARLTEPYLLARSTEIVSKQVPDKVREESLTEELTGYFLAQLSASPGYRLGRALREAGPPSSAMLQELPAQALIAWDERGDKEFVLKRLKNRIAESVARQAREASIRPDKVDDPDDEPADVGLPDADLEQFEREETLRQELAILRAWVERAGLSEQQKQVYELDMSTNFDTEAISRQLGISRGHVRKVRHDYREKIKTAAGL